MEEELIISATYRKSDWKPEEIKYLKKHYTTDTRKELCHGCGDRDWEDVYRKALNIRITKGRGLLDRIYERQQRLHNKEG